MSAQMTPPEITPDMPPAAELARIETLAAELAALAGADIQFALGKAMQVSYKGAPGWTRDPVSEVDHACEVMIRARLAEAAPGHDIIGEELDERPGRDHDWVWAIDPIDGTANFVSGLPLFSASIGVLYRGHPVAGALWCSTSHALRPGVYSAHRGGALNFDGAEVPRPDRAQVRRSLVATPDGGTAEPFDTRLTGSAAIECAFVAAGLLAGARFGAPNLWDVAGGAALVLAAGGGIRIRTPQGWQPFTRFEGPEGDLARWRAPMALGRDEALDALLA